MHSLAHIELAPLSESEILRRARARRDRRRAGTTSGAPVVSRVARYAILLSALVVAIVLANAAAAHASQFANWAQAPGAVAVAGDFNGDGRGDVALVGPGGWSTVPVAFSLGNGTFSLTNRHVAKFPAYAHTPGAKPVAGDFNHDGRDDIALVGPVGWATVPVAFSLGNGTFKVTNSYEPTFPVYAQAPTARPVAGDFNHDGRDDIALVGGPGWTTVPVAFSLGNGTFDVTNHYVPKLPQWAQTPGVQPVSGDYNHDGRADIALVGPDGWLTVPVAFSTGAGSFTVTNHYVADFPGYAQTAGAKPVAGDFNADGRSDIALVGPAGWLTVPVAFSTGKGIFTTSNALNSSFPIYAQAPGARPVAGDYNHDGRGDIALVGGTGWQTLPVAFSSGNGSFAVTNQLVP